MLPHHLLGLSSTTRPAFESRSAMASSPPSVGRRSVRGPQRRDDAADVPPCLCCHRRRIFADRPAASCRQKPRPRPTRLHAAASGAAAARPCSRRRRPTGFACRLRRPAAERVGRGQDPQARHETNRYRPSRLCACRAVRNGRRRPRAPCQNGALDAWFRGASGGFGYLTPATRRRRARSPPRAGRSPG